MNKYNWPLKDVPHEKMQQIEDLASDAKTLEEISQATQLSYDRVRNFLIKNKIDYLKVRGLSVSPMPVGFEKDVRAGKDIRFLSSTYSLSNNSIYHLISKHRLSKAWKSGKNMNHQKTFDSRTNLVLVLSKYLDQKNYQKSWAEIKAIEYYQSSTGIYKRRPMSDYVKIFEIYQKAMESGRPISYKQIGNKIGAKPGYVRTVIRRVNLESMFWTNEYKPRLNIDDENVFAAYDLGLSGVDIDNFLNRSGLFQARSKKNKFHIKRTCGKLDGIKFKFSFASNVYEAIDLGFTPQEISQLYNKSESLVASVINKRSKAEEIIINALALLYPDKKFTKPYLSSVENLFI